MTTLTKKTSPSAENLLCRYPNCNKVAVHLGAELCSTHFSKELRERYTLLGNICNHPGCESIANHKEKSGVWVCGRHRAQRYVKRKLEQGKPCSHPSCSSIATIGSLCAKHHRKVKREKDTRQCHICKEPLYQRGLCVRHYESLRRFGDPLAVKRVFAKRGSGSTDPKGYRHIHVGGKQVFEHRFVMERTLGRSLLPSETIHHRDGNRSNNSQGNLEIWVRSQPCGQRIEDKLEYASRILKQYGNPSDSVESPKPAPLMKGESGLTLKDQRCESRGLQLLWDTVYGLGSATTTELSSILRVTRPSLTALLGSHQELFKKVPRLPRDDRRSFRWVTKHGSKRPESTKQGSVTSDGYRVMHLKGRYHLEHRLVMEQHLGRKLLPKENVHHKDGDRLNNDISNLELWSTSQPPGQRVEDLLKWAHEIIQLYGQVKPTPEEPKQESQTPTRYKRPWVI